MKKTRKRKRADYNIIEDFLNDQQMEDYDQWVTIVNRDKANENKYLLNHFGYTPSTYKYRKLIK